MSGFQEAWSATERDQIRAMIANGATSAVVMAATGRTKRSILQGVKRYRLGPWLTYAPRPIPDGFADDAAVMSDNMLMRKHHAGKLLIWRWREESGVLLAVVPKKKSGKEPMRIPADFAEQARTKNDAALAAHYGLGRTICGRWRRKLGAYLVREPRASKPRKARVLTAEQTNKAVKSKPPTGMVQAFHKSVAITVFRDMSPAGQAADALRRDRWVVYRANEAGRQDVSGKFWVCGKMPVMTDKELVAFVTERTERAARLARAA